MLREEAIEYLQKLYLMADITDEYGDMDDTTPYETAVDIAIEALQEQKTGKWIDAWCSAFDGTRHWYRECSECGYERDDDNHDKDTNYCPNCGSHMENGGEDD